MLFVYVYFTDGLQEWARCFLESFRFFNGTEIFIVAEARDLSSKTEKRLRALYPNLELRNRPLDFDALADMAQTSVKTLRRWKDEVEHQVTTDENYRWKLLISAKDRYQSLLPVLDECVAGGYTQMLHSDVDVYFRRALGRLDELIRENDVSLYFRSKGIWGGLLGINATEGARSLLADWRERIDRMPLVEMPRGYGQTSLLEAYRALGPRCRWGDLATDPRSFSIAKTDNINPDQTKDADLWIGNSNRGRNRKDASVVLCLEDLDRVKKEGRRSGAFRNVT